MPHHKHRAHPHPRAVDEVAGDSADIVGEPMAQLDERQMATIVSVVYVTAAPTFSGPVGGYTTLGPAVGDPVSAPAATASAASSVAQDTLSPESSVTPTASVVASALSSAAASSTSASSVSGSSSPSSTISPSSSVLSSTALASSSVAPTSTDESAQSTALGASATSSNASPTATSSSSSQGMSGGAKAGLAIGLIFGIGLILGLILFCFRRKKQQQEASYAKADDEKSAYGNRPGYAPSARSTNAPRLSLRPVTQFSPNLGGDRRSMGNALAVASAAATAPSGFSQPRKPTQAVADTVGDRMAMEDRANDPQNPFGNHATEPQPIQNPFGNHAETIDPLPQPEHPESEGLPVAAASDSSVPSDSNHLDLEDAVEVTAAGLDATGAAALTEEHQNSSRPSNASGEARPASPTLPVESTPPSPVGTEFSNTSEVPATPTTPQAGVVKSGVVVTNVHRVQLPFKPSMEDEIELCAGQLVRLLHEYDDGWVRFTVRLERRRCHC
ncbi:MAG: hypothetical protein M1819_005367 [Sarea resinae]|nr:MAG: hypothetical protein M1819_005367 [Sarea resinae]